MDTLMKTYIKSAIAFALSFVLIILLSGCSGFKTWMLDNKNELVQAGLTCIEEDTFYAGFLTEYEKDLTGGVEKDMYPARLVAVFGCGDRLETLTCDVTRKPNESPCQDLRTWMITNRPENMREAWE